MAKEQFSIAGSYDVLGYIDEAARKVGLSRGEAFADFLTFVRCALAGQTMKDEYLTTIAKGYAKGKEGKRGIDIVTKAFGTLVNLMEETGHDVLGDVFTGGITYGESGQFFTPPSVAQMMAEFMSAEDDGERKSVCDPACGSGRTLLEVAKKYPQWTYTGQDVDHRCAQMTAINLGLHGLFGWAVWQNTLTLEAFRVYKIGFNLSGGAIREIPVAQSPFNDASDPQPLTPHRSLDQVPSEPPPAKQIDLF